MNNKIISDTFSLAGNEAKTILEETNLKVYVGNSLRQTIKLSWFLENILVWYLRNAKKLKEYKINFLKRVYGWCK